MRTKETTSGRCWLRDGQHDVASPEVRTREEQSSQTRSGVGQSKGTDGIVATGSVPGSFFDTKTGLCAGGRRTPRT